MGPHYLRTAQKHPSRLTFHENIKIKAFLRGQLAPGRAQELPNRAAGRGDTALIYATATKPAAELLEAFADFASNSPPAPIRLCGYLAW